jgi:Domain of Unknown Function (DUF928)
MNYLPIGLILLLGLLLIPVSAFADDPDEAPPSGRSAGGRGCSTAMPSESDVPNLILLAPQGSQQTVSTRPTFAWFVRDNTSVPIEFRLYSQIENDRYQLVKEIKDEQFRSAPGIMVLSWDQTAPELAIGKYRWQVVLVCDRDRPSSHLFATSEIEVVPASADLKTRLEQTRDPLAQSSIYAEANLWYDALGIAIASSTPLKASQVPLLDRMALNDAERQRLQQSAIHFIQR